MSLSLTYLLRVSDEVFQGNDRVANPNDISTTFQRINLTAAWKINDHLILRGTLPWTTATREENGLPDNTFSGLGDASISLLWSPWREHKTLSGLAFTMGLILPTGDAREQPLAGVAAPSVLQAGTGVFQGTLGLSYARTIQDWNLGASFDTSFPLHESDQNFRPAATYYASLYAGRSLTENLHAKITMDFFHGTRDEFEGQEIDGTGSTTLSLKPSLIWNITDQFSASASVSVPIWRRVNSEQLAVGPLWSLGMSYNF